MSPFFLRKMFDVLGKVYYCFRFVVADVGIEVKVLRAKCLKKS